jgi:hypothetical protein
MNISQNVRAENNSSKKVKNGRFFHFDATAGFFPVSNFSSYPHKLQNLRFNLAVKKCCAPYGVEDIGKTNERRTLFPAHDLLVKECLQPFNQGLAHGLRAAGSHFLGSSSEDARYDCH